MIMQSIYSINILYFYKTIKLENVHLQKISIQLGNCGHFHNSSGFADFVIFI